MNTSQRALSKNVTFLTVKTADTFDELKQKNTGSFRKYQAHIIFNNEVACQSSRSGYFTKVYALTHEYSDETEEYKLLDKPKVLKVLIPDPLSSKTTFAENKQLLAHDVKKELENAKSMATYLEAQPAVLCDPRSKMPSRSNLAILENKQPGANLFEQLADAGFSERVFTICVMLRAIDHMHKTYKTVYSDLKPQNIIVDYAPAENYAPNAMDNTFFKKMLNGTGPDIACNFVDYLTPCAPQSEKVHGYGSPHFCSPEQTAAYEYPKNHQGAYPPPDVYKTIGYGTDYYSSAQVISWILTGRFATKKSEKHVLKAFDLDWKNQNTKDYFLAALKKVSDCEDATAAEKEVFSALYDELNSKTKLRRKDFEKVIMGILAAMRTPNTDDRMSVKPALAFFETLHQKYLAEDFSKLSNTLAEVITDIENDKDKISKDKHPAINASVVKLRQIQNDMQTYRISRYAESTEKKFRVGDYREFFHASIKETQSLEEDVLFGHKGKWSKRFHKLSKYGMKTINHVATGLQYEPIFNKDLVEYGLAAYGIFSPKTCKTFKRAEETLRHVGRLSRHMR